MNTSSYLGLRIWDLPCPRRHVIAGHRLRGQLLPGLGDTSRQLLATGRESRAGDSFGGRVQARVADDLYERERDGRGTQGVRRRRS